MVLRAIALAIALMAAAAPRLAASGAKLQVTAAQLFQIADAALANGDYAIAQRAYTALQGDPSKEVRLEARYRLAKLEIKRGNLSKAAVLLREIIDERPTAAPVRLALAQLLANIGDTEGAWRQLRAAQASGLPPAVARIVDRYSEALRAQRPFGASFEIALAPDSNINRATRSDTLGTVLGNFQIGKEGQAKSGTGLALNAQAYRRFRLSARSSLLVRAAGFANVYGKHQFNDIAADIAVGPELNLGRDRLQIELGATQRWYGQSPYLRSARLGGTLSHPLGGRTLLRLNGSSAMVDNQLNDLEDGKVYSGQIAIERALTPTTGLVGSFELDRQSLEDPGYSTTGWRGGLTAWRDMGRVTLTAGVEVGLLNADARLQLFPRKRSDRYSRLSFGATFRQIQFRGFAPVARFSIERNRSSVELYDYRRTRTEIGIVRAF